MLMARPRRATSKAFRNCDRVTKTDTSIRPIASTNCEITMATIRRRWMEVFAMLSPQHVSLAAQGVDEFRVVVFQFAPQTRDVDFDHVAEAFPVEIIKVLEQFGLGDHRAGTMREIFEHAILHGGEGNKFSATPHRKVGGADFDIAHFEDGGALALAAADQRFGPGQQFAEIKWLGDIIVGARIEQGDDRLLLVTRRQHQYRDLGATAAQLL